MGGASEISDLLSERRGAAEIPGRGVPWEGGDKDRTMRALLALSRARHRDHFVGGKTTPPMVYLL